MKTFSFRFDIDTHICLTKGVPALMRLAEQLNVQFTFFLSVGRSVSRVGTLKRMLSERAETNAVAEALGPRQKLGTSGYLEVALFNPLIGAAHPQLVRDLAHSQDMGLHGGRNHDVWHHSATAWSIEVVRAELEWALGKLGRMDVQPKGFSCPGWTEPPGLAKALAPLGFEYRADRHGHSSTGGVLEEGGLLNLGTNILGEPGGVAYLEHMRALKKSDAEIHADFRARLKQAGDYAVVYDHPYYAGLHDLAMVKDLVSIAREEGFFITPLIEVARQLRRHQKEVRA